MSDAEKRVVLITGAAGGLGQASVKRFIDSDHIVIGTDIRLREDLFTHSQVIYREADVTSETDWTSVMEMVSAEFGRLDALVNNAAILMAYTLEQHTLDDFRRIMDVNVSSVFLGMKAGLPLLRKSTQGSIVNLSSSSAVAGYPHFAAYGATKAAVRNLTMSTAALCQTQDYGVRCNSVHPDGILTDMIGNMKGEFPEMDPAKAERAFKFACEPEAIADVVHFLTTDEARHINGAEIRVDNASTVQMPYL